VPLDRLLVETDAPDQTPVSRRPARNEPAFLVEIVRALAQIRGESEEALARATSENARRLFLREVEVK
jgi:TatD DNase family protein